MYNCKKATLILSKRQEEKLSLKEKLLLHFHLLYCRFCRRFGKQTTLLKHALLKLDQKNEKGEYLFQFTEERKTLINTIIYEELKK